MRHRAQAPRSRRTQPVLRRSVEALLAIPGAVVLMLAGIAVCCLAAHTASSRLTVPSSLAISSTTSRDHRTFDAAAAGSAVFPFGGAPSLGSLAGSNINAPVVGMAGTASVGGTGWLRPMGAASLL